MIIWATKHEYATKVRHVVSPSLSSILPQNSQPNGFPPTLTPLYCSPNGSIHTRSQVLTRSSIDSCDHHHLHGQRIRDIFKVFSAEFHFRHSPKMNLCKSTNTPVKMYGRQANYSFPDISFGPTNFHLHQFPMHSRTQSRDRISPRRHRTNCVRYYFSNEKPVIASEQKISTNENKEKNQLTSNQKRKTKIPNHTSRKIKTSKKKKFCTHTCISLTRQINMRLHYFFTTCDQLIQMRF